MNILIDILLGASAIAFLLYLIFSPNRKWALLSFVLFISNMTKPSEALFLAEPLEIIRGKSRLLCLLAVICLPFFNRKKSGWLGVKPSLAFATLMSLQLFLLAVDFFRISFINDQEIYQRALIDLLFLFSMGMVVASWINNFEDVQWFFRSVAGGTILFLAATAIQFLWDPSQEVWNGRLFGVSAHPNFAAVMFSISVLVCLWLSQSVLGKRERYFWILLTLLCGIGLVWTGSRTGFLMAVVGVGVYIFSTRKGLVFLCVGLLAIPLLAVSNLLPEFTIAINRVLSGANTRAASWSLLWSQFTQNPVFGLPTNEIQASENSYLWIALRGGIVGLALLLLVWFLIFKNLKYLMDHQKPFLKNAERLLFACFCSYFVGSFFEGYINMTLGYQILIFYGLITALSRLSRVTAKT